MKILGSSIKKDFVKCYFCSKKFSWLNCYNFYDNAPNGYYYACCARCKKLEVKAMLVK